MADSFRLVPVEPEVAPGDRQICRYSHFLALARGQEGAIVADAQAKAAACRAGCTLANFGEQSEFASRAPIAEMGRFCPHFMRIGQSGAGLYGGGSW